AHQAPISQTPAHRGRPLGGGLVELVHMVLRGLFGLAHFDSSSSLSSAGSCELPGVSGEGCEDSESESVSPRPVTALAYGESEGPLPGPPQATTRGEAVSVLASSRS